MNTMLRWSVVAMLCVAGLSKAGVLSDDEQPAESAQVGGKNLRLNGSGLGQRFAFKIYAISLYLLEPKHKLEAILASDEPRRLSIVMLRDVSSRVFAQAIVDSLADQDAGHDAGGLAELGTAIASQARGLRKGDRLTLDWVPGVGTVIELNERPLARPSADRNLHNAILKIWLGAKPADTSLKSKLLGAATT